MSRPALIVFAKAPEPGRVKTRLCPPLTPEEAAALYEAFLRDALDRYARLGAEADGPAPSTDHGERPGLDGVADADADSIECEHRVSARRRGGRRACQPASRGS